MKKGRPPTPQHLDFKGTVDNHRSKGNTLYVSDIAYSFNRRPQQFSDWYVGKPISMDWQDRLIRYFERNNIDVKVFNVDKDKEI